MDELKPGATYIHERVDNVVYAREFGADPSTRQVVGWDYDHGNPQQDPRISDGQSLRDHLQEAQLWGEIRRAAKTNTALQEALDQCVIIYQLIKKT